MKVSGKVVFDGVLVLVFAVMVVMSFNYNSHARLIPLLVGIPSFIFSVIQLIADGTPSPSRSPIFRLTQQRGISATGGIQQKHENKDTEKSTDDAMANKKHFNRAVRVFAWLTLFTILLGITNYNIVIPVFIFLFMFLESKLKLATSILLAACTEGFIYVLFNVLLKATF